MTKLTYTNDQQIINDAAQMLLENHLRWGGSNEGMPSKDLDYVQGQVIDAYIETNFTYEEWDELPAMSQILQREIANSFYKQAAQLADRKWMAAMTLLGIEQ